MRTATAAECEPLFQRFISFNPRFANVALLDAAGRVAAGANQRPLNPQTSLLKFDRYREAIESPGLRISGPYSRALTGEWTCLVSLPLTLSDGSRAALVTPIDLQEFADLLALARNPAAYTAVVLDLTMPHLGGQETMQRLRSVRPDLPVLLISGYNRQLEADGIVLDAHTDFLAKLFDLPALAAALDRLLATPA
ncbi:MAG: hypothetical protein RIS54_1484 [Verrucomicrobiota bacterium]